MKVQHPYDWPPILVWLAYAGLFVFALGVAGSGMAAVLAVAVFTSVLALVLLRGPLALARAQTADATMPAQILHDPVVYMIGASLSAVLWLVLTVVYGAGAASRAAAVLLAGVM
ncbi:MAG: hypothetical protein ACRCTD_08460 [Beijerinckiaceae bacterium]